MLHFYIADLARDGQILTTARDTAFRILENDPGLVAPEHVRLQKAINQHKKEAQIWGRIS
jgi:ATP-dependent DNA helicase RecG